LARTQEHIFTWIPQKALFWSSNREMWPGREALSSTVRHLHLPKPASWDEREEGVAVLPTMGLTTAGEPGPRSIKLSSVTSFSTCQDIRLGVRSQPLGKALRFKLAGNCAGLHAPGKVSMPSTDTRWILSPTFRVYNGPRLSVSPMPWPPLPPHLQQLH
jgi:hypothetical protein